jgi:hypothetical protein
MAEPDCLTHPRACRTNRSLTGNTFKYLLTVVQYINLRKHIVRNVSWMPHRSQLSIALTQVREFYKHHLFKLLASRTYQWLYSLSGPWPFFQFLDLYTVGRTHLTGDPPRRYLHTRQHKHRINAHRHPCLEWNSNPRSQYLNGRRLFMP